jgi:branched-chain amino acid transport system substrate-binding protein
MNDFTTDTHLARATAEVRRANEAGGDAARVRVGILTPLTETGAMVAGEMLTRGACLAADYVREHRILGDTCLELVLADDQASAAKEAMWRSAVGEMAKLAIVDRVVAVLGNWMVRTTAHVVELSHRLGIPHFVTTGHPTITRQQYDTVFRTFYTTEERADIMVRFMKARGARRVAVIASTSPFGKFYADAVEAKCTAGEQPCDVMRIDFDPDAVTDFTGSLQRIKAWEPDYVINLGIIARDSIYNIINQAAGIGLCPAVPMLVGIPVPSAASDFWRRVGANGHCITWAATQFQPDWPGLTPIGQWFVARYSERYGGFPSEMSLTSFTDVTIIAQALARTSGRTAAQLVDALESGTFDTWHGPLAFRRDADHWHHSASPLQLMQYQRVDAGLRDAAIVYPPELQTHPYMLAGAVQGAAR